MIGTWPSVILCFIAARCPKGSVSAWLLVHMSMGSLVAWWKPCGPTAWPSVAPTSLITSTMPTHPSSDSGALTLSLRRLIGFLVDSFKNFSYICKNGGSFLTFKMGIHLFIFFNPAIIIELLFCVKTSEAVKTKPRTLRSEYLK